MRTFFVIIIMAGLSGCFGYKIISKAELEQVKKMSYLTGRMESINRAARTESPEQQKCTIEIRKSYEKSDTDSGFVPCGRADTGGGPF